MRSLLALVTLVGCTLLAACGAQSSQPPADVPAEDGAATTGPATGRSLAASVMAHLPAGRATDPSGATTDTGAWGGVEVTGGGIESAMVGVSEPLPGLEDGACGGDSGYDLVWCRGGDEPTSLLVRRNDNDRQPIVMARHGGGERGDVLVQVWGPDVTAARALATAVVEDPAVGLTTSADRLRVGDALGDFRRDEIEAKVFVEKVDSSPMTD